ncbi:hypothetical protein MMC12_007885 [Toensbergia leucococca]|nr:hypothetical protein [Toensbergia leucococca]
MSQSFNNYKSDPQGHTDSNYAGLSGSLMYPAPQPNQQNNQQGWSGTPAWQDHRTNSYKYPASYPGQVTDQGGYFPNQQQDIVPYDEGEDFYENEDEDLVTDKNARPQASNSIAFGLNALRTHPPPTLQNPTTITQATTPLSTPKEQVRAQSLTVDSTNTKTGPSTPNDRAAELRARLLANANRGSTPTAGISSNKTNIPAKSRSKEPTTDFKQYSGMASDLKKSRGTGETTTEQVPTVTKTDDKSKAKSHAASSEKIDSSTDIDGLFAEARAAVAAESIKTETKGTADQKKNQVNGSINGGRSANEVKAQSNVLQDLRPNSAGSLASSEASELGEIRNDSGKAGRPSKSSMKPKEPQAERRASGETKIPIQQVKSNLNKQLPKKIDTTPASGRKERQVGNFAQLKQSPSSAIQKSLHSAPSQPREKMKNLKAEYRQDRFERQQQSTQDRRNDHEWERAREPSQRENEVETRRLQTSRSVIDEAERAAADYKIELEARRPQMSRAVQDENKRNVVDDKMDYEARQMRSTRQTIDEMEPPTTDITKIYSKTTGMAPSAIDEHRTPPEKVMNVEDVEDLDEWLEMTGYHDRAYRKKALERQRRLIALDLQRVELEREAQTEHEEKSHSARFRSILPRESVEVSTPRTSNTHRAPRASSIFAMPPPPPPVKETRDDLGIKIKDLASRENMPAERLIEDDIRASMLTQDSPIPVTPTRKRYHIDDDTDIGILQRAEKLPRTDADGYYHERRSRLSPAPLKSEHWSLESRISRGDDPYRHEYLPKEVYAEHRRASRSPPPRRTSTSDMHSHRQYSSGSLDVRNERSPIRRTKLSRESSPTHHANGSSTWVDYHRDDHHKHDDYNIKHRPEPESRSSLEYLQPSNTSQQRYISSNYRGRGRGGYRGGYANSRGGSLKPYKPIGGTHDVEHSGSASLDLRAGGQYRY